MSWEIKKDDNLLTVAIEGRFVAAVAPDLREEVSAKISDGTNVLFDLGKMVHIDSSVHKEGLERRTAQVTQGLGGERTFAES